MTLASLNLHGGVDSQGQPFDVVSAIRHLDSEVICLQEAWLPASDGAPPKTIGRYTDQVADAAAELKATLFRAPMRSRRPLASADLEGESGRRQVTIAVLTRLRVSGYETAELGWTPGDVFCRLAQVLTLELPNQAELRLVNTHLTHRLASPLQLFRLRRVLGSHWTPTIVAGDLNMPRCVADLMPGYSDAVRGKTWPAERPVVQLDHVLVSAGVSVLDGAVLPAVGSDHLPVWAKLRL